MRYLRLVALALFVATPAIAQGTAEQREACTPDALKLCSNTIPDVGKTTACMKTHLVDLSPRCRAAFDAAPLPVLPAVPVPVQLVRPVGRPRIRQTESHPLRYGRVIVDPDAEVPYVVPRRVIAPPVYSEPGPVIFPKQPLPDGSFCSPPYDVCEPEFLDEGW